MKKEDSSRGLIMRLIHVNLLFIFLCSSVFAQVKAVDIDAEMKSHRISPVSTGSSMSVLVMSVEGFTPREDDQIAAFSNDDLLVGVGTFDENGRADIVVWGDDPSTEKIDGLLEDEPFRMRIWSIGVNEELVLSVKEVLYGSGLVYKTDGMTVLDMVARNVVPENFYLSEPYPNPFNTTLHLSYGIPETGQVTICVYDITGRIAATLVDGEIRAGQYTLVWDGSLSASGMYVIRMETLLFNADRKVMLLR